MSRNHGEEVPLGPFNYELCAELHNRIFLIAWTAAGKALENSSISTWWGHFQPSKEFAARYHPHLVKFFQRVYYHPEAPEFCYYLENLNPPHSLIDEHFNDISDGRDCYVDLHRATSWYEPNGDEWGIINMHKLDQITCKAVFAESREATHPILNYGHGFRPLEDIYADYLQMITEHKIEAQAVQAFQDLVHEIEIRLPSSSNSSSSDSAQLTLPWSDPAVRSEAHLVPNSFINRFCTATSAATTRPVRFRYLAPGIRLPTEAEFRAQPLRNLEYQSAMHRALPVARPIKPTLLFLADDPAANTPGPTVTTVPKPDLCLNSLLADFGDDKHRRTTAPRPAGLYLTADHRRVKSCENGCRLLLPFGVGRHGWARRSDGTRMGDYAWWGGDPADANYDLYQCEFNGFIPLRDTPLHQMLESWAERVRAGDWTVGPDGVADGVERWREADTEAGWRKYRVPVRW
ncbi:hypothetical protein ASPACDRAFT_1888299 [Aspergillus aculeatus ATCC 16872]|uniref:Uncharacterized protein n=1 Tax=Aspergillus aculeatus (strain ATCC 16872 / CBS 172.66 / WB 5094) TaxID=690307 RepID=A0A1L9WTV8_ASPA1|nr:uncharacterized protein ASPACDRAFT_1888299 [Aspergillus aculeatus ATCC 16872]OJJ99611.1 hypothetical protein ASPACDRAFT_1888299 [Aspergillus aculeatus ATCC 16872]